MTDEEIEKEFDKLFWNDIHIDCWSPSCELRDCCECSIYQDEFDNFKREKRIEALEAERKKQIDFIVVALHYGLLSFVDDDYENQLKSIAGCMYDLGCRINHEK